MADFFCHCCTSWFLHAVADRLPATFFVATAHLWRGPWKWSCGVCRRWRTFFVAVAQLGLCNAWRVSISKAVLPTERREKTVASKGVTGRMGQMGPMGPMGGSAAGSRGRAGPFSLPPSAFSLPPSAFCRPPSAFCRPPSAFSLLPPPATRYDPLTHASNGRLLRSDGETESPQPVSHQWLTARKKISIFSREEGGSGNARKRTSDMHPWWVYTRGLSASLLLTAPQPSRACHRRPIHDRRQVAACPRSE